MTAFHSRIIGTGSYLPEKTVTNADLAATLDTSDEWIRQRTGICQRHIAAEHENASDLALKASQRALEAAGISADRLDLIIVATSTPDMVFPSTACILQAKLGVRGMPAFDVQAVCSGFGSTPGILAAPLHADGSHAGILSVPGSVCGGKISGRPLLQMDGTAVFKFAVKVLEEVALEALAEAGLQKSDIDWLIPHQANIRILQATAKKLGLSMERVITTVDRHANTSAASVPLALDEAVRDGRIKRGQHVMLEGVGGGFTWGAILIKW
jgi:3-oxoacyl-[acyl-carrier-protein] synthase-3